MKMPLPITAAELRAIVARSNEPQYVVAARARVNPIRFSRLLNGHEQIREELFLRIVRAVEEEVADGR